ncbi:hypothetical protein ACFQI3_10425 [Hansschlegelia quercus]|uniref:Uncharacterized protein n=1 Tax=Hansschlegelia quercus TaxID=2528245 RepID=A0A4Q9GJN7_9HYPH|nr:hypothetical protein [Hansschlegelia quercus]TBN54473.1 hypothetical protein EYR15_06495 [Hansschlegelia quercus]
MLHPYYFVLITVLAYGSSAAKADDGAVTQGRDFDTASVAAATDGGLSITVSVRTNGLRVNSTSSITLRDNGKPIFGPETRPDAAWRQQVRAFGRGPHDLRVECGHENSKPVFCRLEIEEQRAEGSSGAGR